MAVFRLSHFRLSTFRRCRRLYKYRYVERLPVPPNPHGTMGSHVHTALRDLMRLPPEQRAAARAADLLRAAWAGNRAGFRGLAEEARWRSRALEQVRRFVALPDAGGTPLALEQQVEVALTDGVRLFGRIDRVDERAEGDLHIIDYKTGRAQEEPDPEQLRIYAMILARTAGRPVGMTSYLYLEDGSAWSASPAPADLAEAEEGVLQTVEEMTREREYAPDVGPQCTFCDFRSICPRRDEIAARGAGAMNADLRVPL